MNKDIQAILDKWINTGEAKHSETPVNMAGLSYIMVSPPKWDWTIFIRDKWNKITVVSFNDILLDSNLFEVLEWKQPVFKSRPSVHEEHKVLCLLLPTQEERVKYILQNLQKNPS